MGKYFFENKILNGGKCVCDICGKTKLAKIGRNDPCPCGSRKKFKECCAESRPPNF